MGLLLFLIDPQMVFFVVWINFYHWWSLTKFGVKRLETRSVTGWCVEIAWRMMTRPESLKNFIVSFSFWKYQVNHDPRWGRIKRTWGEDPYLTGTLNSGKLVFYQERERERVREREREKEREREGGGVDFSSSNKKPRKYDNLIDLQSMSVRSFNKACLQVDHKLCMWLSNFCVDLHITIIINIFSLQLPMAKSESLLLFLHH